MPDFLDLAFSIAGALSPILSFLGIVIGAQALIGPLVMRFQLKSLATPEAEPHPGDGPEEAIGHFEAVGAALEREGFRPVGWYLMRTDHSGLVAHIALFRGANGATLAYAAAIKAPNGFVRYTEIGTAFEGEAFLTVGNSGVLGSYVPRPDAMAVQVPAVQDPAALWRIHKAMVARYMAGRRAKAVPRGAEITYFARANGDSVRHQAKLGLMKPLADGRVFGLTWLGAFFYTWRQIWPLSALLRARARWRSNRLVAELGPIRGVAA